MLSKKQKLCRLLRDMVSVSESTGWAPSSASEAKYRSLGCTLNKLEEKSSEYQELLRHVQESTHREPKLAIGAVYAVHREIEDDNFKHHLKNRKNLFHSSNFKNFVGLLSRYFLCSLLLGLFSQPSPIIFLLSSTFPRGLLLPQIALNEQGALRTDEGMLGAGIYFAADPSVSSKVSRPFSFSSPSLFTPTNQYS